MNQTRKQLFSVISVVLSLLMVISVISFPSLKVDADGAAGTLDDFVERCYTVTLDRGSDPEGFAYWKGRLLNGEAVGIEVAYGFLFSKEYTRKNKSNEDYVKDLYMLFMGREPDPDGFNDWVGQLNSGKSRLEVYAGFANSQEFFNICDSYKVTAGRFVKGYDRNTINNVNLFVERLYKICLGRTGDKDGQKNWVEKLITKQISGSECARSFIFSKEYVNKNLSDEEFVENLYLAMFGRRSDAGGKKNWLFALRNGMTRDEVFEGFANSIEFDNICKAYGINRGSYTAKDKGTFNPNGDNTASGNNTDNDITASENNTEKENPGENNQENPQNDNTASENNTQKDHTHSFTVRNMDSKYLKSAATCKSPAIYYYSCECGERGTGTFKYGKVSGHNYGKYASDKYLKSKDCEKGEEYYYSCKDCGKKDTTKTFKVGGGGEHIWSPDYVNGIIKEPTLTEKGKVHAKCAVPGCSATTIEDIDCLLATLEPGNYVQFGKYESDMEPGADGIDWIVGGLNEDGQRLLIAKNALDVVPYHDKTNVASTWATSTIRNWLNNDFKNTAFSEEELRWIAETKVKTPDNPYYSTGEGGEDTMDYVFILSMEELKKEFGVDYSDTSKQTFFSQGFICLPSDYALNKGAFLHIFTDEEIESYKNKYGGKYANEPLYGGTVYWVRDPGMDNFRKSIVQSWGEIGKDVQDWQYNDLVAVRPAIYVNFEK